MLTDGRISLNGKVVKEPGTKISTDSDQLSVDGRLVEARQPPKVYWLLHKPDFCLTSRAGEEGKGTIYDLPALKNLSFALNPVGRLDYRTEGLLLLSNDGELVHRLTHPRYKVQRTYQVLVNRRLTNDEEKKLKAGITLEDGPVQGVELDFIQTVELGNSRGAFYLVRIKEGRNRVVRRLFEALETKVVRLIRVAYGDLYLPERLAPGDYRQLSSAEIMSLKKAVGLN